MRSPKNFKDFLNEASLKGNIGIPGESGEAPSWLDKVNREQRQKAMSFERENRDLLMNFPRLIGNSQRLQSGKEEELSTLAETCFRELFGSIINDVELDLKISRAEVQQMLSETPDEPEIQNVEDIVDQKIIDEIQKRKILRTIQQGKGLNAKAVLNLPLFKKGIEEILKDKATEYIDILNKIVKVMTFFDTTLPEAEIARVLRNTGSGACKLEFSKKDLNTEEKEIDAEKLLKDLEEGKDLSETETELFDDMQTTVKARGADLGVLLHEAIKGIYKLATQMSLEHLSEKEAEEVLSNTDTLLDEAQEFKYGREMEDQLRKVVMSNPKVKEILSHYENILDSGTAKEKDQAANDIAGFQEQLFFYVFGYLAAEQDAKKMLKVVHGVLMNNQEEIEKLFYPIVEESVKSLKSEHKYQKQMGVENTPVSTTSGEKTKEELMELLDDAEDKEEYEEAARLRDQIKKRFPEK
jgi:protein-arginine kinase activator protein McsA